MVNEILDSTAVGKLKGILKDRYGKSLRLSFIQDVSCYEVNGDSVLLAEGHLHIPIQVNGKFLATAVVENGSSLNHGDQQVVSQLVRLFIEPEIFNWYVEQMTHNMNIEETENVITLRRDESQDRQTTASTTNVLCLQAKNPHLISRMAQNVHEVSERWAYLKFSDIESGIQTVADLKSLGSLTVFIPDILELSPDRQALLLSYLSNSTPADEPLILIGTTTAIEELEAKEMIARGFGQILRVHRVEVERMPRDPKQLQETLEIMLEF